MKNAQWLTTSKIQLPENLYLDKKVDGWAVCFCLSPLETSRFEISYSMTVILNNLDFLVHRILGLIK